MADKKTDPVTKDGKPYSEETHAPDGYPYATDTVEVLRTRKIEQERAEPEEK